MMTWRNVGTLSLNPTSEDFIRTYAERGELLLCVGCSHRFPGEQVYHRLGLALHPLPQPHVEEDFNT